MPGDEELGTASGVSGVLGRCVVAPSLLFQY